MRIAVITACWRRPEIFEVFCRNMAALEPRPLVLCAGSPGDQCAAIAAKYGLIYQAVKNHVSTKWNHAVRMGPLATEATHYLFMGSDDLMDQRCWDYYQRYTGQHLALRDYYFLDHATRRLLYWPGYQDVQRRGTDRTGEPIGAAKLVRRDALEAINWEPFDPQRPNALDFDMHHKLLRAGVRIDVVRMNDTGGISLDVKGNESLTSFGRIQRIPYVEDLGCAALQDISPQLYSLLYP